MSLLAERLVRYSTIAILLHWLIAALIVSNIVIGVRMRDMEDAAAKLASIQLHESIGISVLILSLVRIAWRMAHPASLPAAMKPWEKRLARTVHVALYVIMLTLPLTGWLVATTRMTLPPIRLFDAVPWPWLPTLRDLAPADVKQVNGISLEGHILLGRLTLALVLLHVGGALKHMIRRDGIVWRMLPFGMFLPARGSTAWDREQAG